MKVDEDSLTTILPTPGLRTELALLLALCTDQMRRDVLANFPEPEPRNVVSASLADSRPSPVLCGDLIDFTEAQSDEAEAAKDRQRQRDRDLASPQMQRMKRAALSFFDDWRLGMLRRVGEVLGVKAQDIRQRRGEYNAQVQAQDGRKKMTKPTASNESMHGLVTGAIIPTSLSQLEEKKHSKILLCLLLLTLSLERYTAHSRVLLQMVTASLQLSPSTLPDQESTVSHLLLSTAANMSAEESSKKEAAENAVGRKWKVGLATVAGAALIGVTGGLAAPFLAAGIGTVMGGLGLSIPLIGGYLGAMAGSSILIGGLFGSYGGRMTGKMMEKYAKEVEDFSFVPLKENLLLQAQTVSDPMLEDAKKSTQKLRVAIGISGWLMDESDITAPWKVLSSSTIEPFALRWEVSSLSDLGISMSKVLKSAAWSAAKFELVRRTIFASLFAGLWPLGLLRIARVLDNPYSVAKARSDKAGRVLAEALIQKVQGERPVVLIGYSLGARVIFQALLALAERNAFGLVESVILIGAPTSIEEGAWRRIRGVVTGRVVNVYSQEDYILGFLYRTSSLHYGVAGLQAIEGVDRVENYDATKLMNGKGHAQYKLIIGQILREIGVEDLDMAMVEHEELQIKEANPQSGVEDLISTDDLLGATELPENWEEQQTQNEKKEVSIPQTITPIPQNVSPKPPAQTSMNLIDTSPLDVEPGSSHPATPATEDEESDDDLNQGIQMVDLDPEPILD